MSGQPLRNATDASKFRQNYLANLALEANNNDINLQANKIFKKTGQTPTQVLDTRTTAEKLADIERLKIDVRSSLSQIADGTQAEAIVQELDPQELTFLAQHIEEIIKDIKPKYKYGVPADIFVPYLISYMRKANATNEVNFGLQQEAGRHLIMSVEQILNDMVNPAMLQQLRQTIEVDATFISAGLQNAIRRDLQDLSQVIPKKDELIQIAKIQDAITRRTIQEELSDALQVLPTNQQLVALVRELDLALQRRDRDASERIGLQLHQLLSVEPATKEQVANIAQQIEDARIQNAGLHRQTQSKIDMTEEELKKYIQARLNAMGLSNRKASLEDRDLVLQVVIEAIDNGNVDTRDALTEYIDETIKHLGQGGNGGEQVGVAEAQPITQRQQEIQSVYRSIDSPSLDTNHKLEMYITTHLKYLVPKPASKGIFTQQIAGKSSNLNKADLQKVVKEINRQLRIQGWGTENPAGVGEGIGGRIKGRGIARNAVVKKTDYSQGIMPVNKYVPFGKYHIDSHKLNNDVISLKRGTGCNVAGFPVERVSRELGNVMRTIVGGGQPQFHQLEKLSPDEKLYLHKVAKHSNIIDRISIPTPNKDDDEKDINQFEIYKGEILNGNDSADLVKKFKILIMKMVKKDLLPKSQAKELLMDLVSLGY